MAKYGVSKIAGFCVLVASLYTSACHSSDEDRTTATPAKVAKDAGDQNDRELMQSQDADSLWQELITVSAADVNQTEGESSLAYFLRGFDTLDRRRRDLGIDFWYSYPTDPRRYKWLILTIHMPPSYALDQFTWARQEATTRPNLAGLDAVQIAKWQSMYSEMRDEFWNSDDVTDVDRRFLRFGELQQEIIRARNENVKSAASDHHSLADKIVAFAEEYPRPFGELDSNEYQGLFVNLVNLYISGFDLSRDDIREFVQDLAAADSRSAKLQAAILKRFKVEEQVENRPSTVSDIEWTAIRNFYQGVSVSNLEGSVVAARKNIESKRKYRELGAKLWAEQPNHQHRVFWLSKTLSENSNSLYIRPKEESLYRLAVDSWSNLEIDEAHRAEWQGSYAKFRSEIWSDPETTNEQRAIIRGLEVGAELNSVRQQLREEHGTRSAQHLLEGIHELYADFGNTVDVERYSAAILMEPQKYGVDDDTLKAFFQRMLDYEDDRLVQLARGAMNQVKLRDTPFEFSAQLIDGTPFDMAEMRGKIVLVDHWATTCASCIASMPKIRDVYESYRVEGFEVVSICYDCDSQRDRLERINRELGLTWTTLIADDQLEDVLNRYSYRGVPQYMLLNRNGTLYAGTGEVDMGRNLEALLEEMLVAEAAEKEAATVH